MSDDLLPDPPEGMFWRVRGSYSRFYPLRVSLMRKRRGFLMDEEVDKGVCGGSAHQIAITARNILSNLSSDHLRFVGDYPPKRLTAD